MLLFTQQNYLEENMKLSYISIENYRSITTAHKIEPSSLTVLIGKNNEGKSNTVKAIALGMEIIGRIGRIGRRRSRVFYDFYDWDHDFPIGLQKSKKLKNKSTKIRFDFRLKENEIDELYELIGSKINGELSIYIELGENHKLSVTVPKKGKNAKTLSSKISIICSFIYSHFEVQYIPAIRSGEDAMSVMNDLLELELRNINDQVYIDSLDYINKKQEEVIDDLLKKLTKDLKDFLPEIKKISLNYNTYKSQNIYNRRRLNVMIDDGVLTDLSYKGDGVKSLITMALLSNTSNNKDRLVIVDEPENSLHPGAIRYISGVLHQLSNSCQVIISTHDAIFINRSNVSSNWIVDNHKATQAKRIDDIRKNLGIICSDNLIYSDYVIVVEGPTDKDFLLNVFKSHSKIMDAIQSNYISINAIGGINNLKFKVSSLQRYCCNYLLILDYDKAGKEGIKNVKDNFSVPEGNIRFFRKERDNCECELEDLLDPRIYKEYLLKNGIDISSSKFKDNSKKWSKRIADIASEAGIDFNSDFENDLKKEIQNLVNNSKSFLNDKGKTLLNNICKKIEDDIDKNETTH